MNWDTIEGMWNQLKGAARERWGEITESEWEQTGGKRDKILGKLQEKYGWTRERAERELDEWGSGFGGRTMTGR